VNATATGGLLGIRIEQVNSLLLVWVNFYVIAIAVDAVVEVNSGIAASIWADFSVKNESNSVEPSVFIGSTAGFESAPCLGLRGARRSPVGLKGYFAPFLAGGFWRHVFPKQPVWECCKLWKLGRDAV
jgi:hypothetical protein